jgi:hypothetical protein
MSSALLVTAALLLLTATSMAEEDLTVLYSGKTTDNIVTKNATAIAAAKKAGYRASTNTDGSVSDTAGPDKGVVELKTFYKASIADTLTVASAAGLAYANSNGYTYVRSEGFAWADETSCKAAPPIDNSCAPMLQYYSSARNDNFLANTAVHVNIAKHAKYVMLRTEAFCKGPVPPPTPPPTPPPPTPPPTIPTKEWLAWPQPSANDPQVADCPFEKSKDLTGFEYLNTMSADPSALKVGVKGNSADTWYPTASLAGKLYTPWTDGKVHGISASSGGTGATTGRTHPLTIHSLMIHPLTIHPLTIHSLTIHPLTIHPLTIHPPLTGMASVTLPPDFDPVRDVFKLTVENVSTFHASAAPYQGRYPCGSLFYKGTWWYGTYSLENPSFPTNPKPDCGNWCVQGPFCGFRWSTDEGKSWTEPRLNMSSGSDNLFGENAFNNSKVKFGAPHVVDFGRELEHSPDGKMYIIGHGASLPSAHQSWMQGDEVYLARVTPTIEAVNDKTQWEFYAGKNGQWNGTDDKWTKVRSRLRSLDRTSTALHRTSTLLTWACYLIFYAFKSVEIASCIRWTHSSCIRWNRSSCIRWTHSSCIRWTHHHVSVGLALPGGCGCGEASADVACAHWGDHHDVGTGGEEVHRVYLYTVLRALYDQAVR